MKHPRQYSVIIVADGTFPTHSVPLDYLANADKIVCCDGSTENLLKAGFIPDAIVGDMDSLSPDLVERFKDRTYPDLDQETNDLTKAVMWCKMNNFSNLIIVGATGKREDHTIANISLLAEYIRELNILMVTDTGVFQPCLKSSEISSFPGQQVSIFSIDPETEITSSGLKYPLSGTKLKNWWMATLNEAVEDTFSLKFKGGPVIVYLKFK
jgi:thiamine pyrophosphokinase